jgi:hypothetical protein
MTERIDPSAEVSGGVESTARVDARSTMANGTCGSTVAG